MSKIHFLLSLKSAPVISWVYINEDWYINEFNQKAKEFFGTEDEIVKLISKRKVRNALNYVRTNKMCSNKKINNIRGHTLKIIKDDSQIFTILEKVETDLNKLFGYIDDSGIGIAIIKHKKNKTCEIRYKNKIIESLIDNLDEELCKGINPRIIDKNKKLSTHSCGNNNYLVLVERCKKVSNRNAPLTTDMYKNIKLELNSIYAILDLSEENESTKDVRESCDEISQSIDDYYYSTLIDRDEVHLDLLQLNIHDLVESFKWKEVKINHCVYPLPRGDIKKIKYILNALYTSESCIEIFIKTILRSSISRIRKSNHIDLENIYFRIKNPKELNNKSLRYKIIKYLCEIMNGNIYDYDNEVLFNIVLESDHRHNNLGLLTNSFQDKNILVWSESIDNWNTINCILTSLGINAVHGKTKKRINSYIKTHKFDAIIIDKSIAKPKKIKTAIYLLPKHTIDTKGSIVIDINEFDIMSAYNVLRQCWRNKKNKDKLNSNKTISSSSGDIKVMKTHVAISDSKSKSLINKQIKSLNQNCTDNPKDADIIIIEILKGQKTNIDRFKKKVIVGINFGPQLTNRQKNKIYRGGISLILNTPVTKNDLIVMYQALSST